MHLGLEYLKAQSAIEYLMTYGWMLLVVAIVGGAVFSVVGDQSIESVSGFSGSEVAVSDFGLSDEGLSFALRNMGSEPLEVKKVRLTDSSENITNEVSSVASLGVGESGNVGLGGVESSDGSDDYQLEVIYDSGGLENLSVSGTVTGSFDVYKEDCSVVAGDSGVYEIDPDGKGGVDPFTVYCEMESDGGGWIKLRIANDCNNDNMFWFSKYSGVDDQESTHGKIGDQFNWSKLNHLSNQSDLVGGGCDASTNNEGFDYVFTGGPYEETVRWHMWSNSSYVYTKSQMDAIRSQVTKISSTTEVFTHTNDDDGCDPNGEWFLKQDSTGAGNNPRYQITHFTSGNQVSEYSIENVTEMANYNDVGYLIPSYLDRYNKGGGCSGEVDHASFGYEKNYTLVK